MTAFAKIFTATAFTLMSASALASSTPITACGTVINSPGDYHLAADLDCSAQPNPIAIRIVNTQDVKLELRGYELKGRPNQTYGGQGTGIYVFNGYRIEIDGSNSRSEIKNFAAGIRFQNSNDSKIDGDFMQLQRNSTGVLVMGSEDLEIKQLKLANVSRDLQIIQSSDVQVRRTYHEGKTSQGILASQSSNLHIKDARMGHRQQVASGVIFQHSYNSRVEESEFDNAEFAVRVLGNGTYGIVLEDNDFGDDAPNTCDLQTGFGAAAATLDNNDPNQLTEC